MSVSIQNIILEKKHIGVEVKYTPKGNLKLDSEYGTISSFDEKSIWVKFKGPNGQLCDSECLSWVC